MVVLTYRLTGIGLQVLRRWPKQTIGVFLLLAVIGLIGKSGVINIFTTPDKMFAGHPGSTVAPAAPSSTTSCRVGDSWGICPPNVPTGSVYRAKPGHEDVPQFVAPDGDVYELVWADPGTTDPRCFLWNGRLGCYLLTVQS